MDNVILYDDDCDDIVSVDGRCPCDRPGGVRWCIIIGITCCCGRNENALIHTADIPQRVNEIVKQRVLRKQSAVKTPKTRDTCKYNVIKKVFLS